MVVELNDWHDGSCGFPGHAPHCPAAVMAEVWLAAGGESGHAPKQKPDDGIVLVGGVSGASGGATKEPVVAGFDTRGGQPSGAPGGARAVMPGAVRFDPIPCAATAQPLSSRLPMSG